MLLPMHLPALLCGFVCGWQWGLGVGFLAPLLRSLTLSMPPFFPMAVSMAFELAAYGAIAGAAAPRAAEKGRLGLRLADRRHARRPSGLGRGALRLHRSGRLGLRPLCVLDGRLRNGVAGDRAAACRCPPLVALFDRLKRSLKTLARPQKADASDCQKSPEPSKSINK